MLAAAKSEPRDRIQAFDIEGTKIWVKHLDVGNVSRAKQLHGWFSKRIIPAPLKSSLVVSPEKTAEREKRKYAAFKKAKIPVPDVLWSNGATIILSDVSPIVDDNIILAVKTGDLEQIDQLLIKFAGALGIAHKAGLCHGRPHVRDAFIYKGQIGFLDFEEEPEAVMPLETAQARDFWLAMLQICSHTSNRQTQQAAFDAWFKNAPDKSVKQLLRLNNFFRGIQRVAEYVPEKWRGNDLKRGIAATDFLDKAFARLV